MGPSEEETYLPISALEHLLYCERQCALIHVDGLWRENASTTAGRQLHERVDEGRSNEVRNVRTLRSVVVRSSELRIVGVADTVEVHGAPGAEVFYPVEYKRGARKKWMHDEVQLAAQAMALEEMLQTSIPMGAIFHGKSLRRRPVAIDAPLREATRTAVARLHRLVANRELPPPVLDARCKDCSLRDLCLPEAASHQTRLAEAIREALA